MNFQRKALETATDFRSRAAALAGSAFARARSRANIFARDLGSLKESLSALQSAGGAFGEVARRHAKRFLKQNTVMAREAGKDVTQLALSTYSQLAGPRAAKPRKARTTAIARKRAASRPRIRKTATA